MSIRMRCRPCGRNYRVPHADGAWNCKQCGAPLVAVPSDEPDPEERRKDELKQVNAELMRWRKTLAGIKAYAILAPSVALGLYSALIGLVVLAQGRTLLAVLALAALLAIVALARFAYGAVDSRPVFATKVLAVGVTLWFLASFLGLAYDPLTGFVGPLVSIWCVIATWASIPRAKRGQELLAQHPDAYRRKGVEERAQVRGPSVVERHRESSKRHGKGQSRIAAWILGGAALVAVIGGFGYWYSIQPSDPSWTLQDFRRSWERGDIDAVASHANSSMVENGLRKYWKKRNWVEEPPDLVGWTQHVKSKERLQVDYELAGGLVSDTRWRWTDGRWKLIAFGYPK